MKKEAKTVVTKKDKYCIRNRLTILCMIPCMLLTACGETANVSSYEQNNVNQVVENNEVNNSYTDYITENNTSYNVSVTSTETESPVAEQPVESTDDFYIEGKWKSIGSEGFGQAQPGAIVVFDGNHCNFFSPQDTYAFYNDGGQYILDCTSFMSTDSLTFAVTVADNDIIEIGYGDTITQLKRVQ